MVSKITLSFCVIGFLGVWLMASRCFADTAAQFDQAEEYENQGQYEQAETIYKAIVAADPNTDEAFSSQEKLTCLYVAWAKQPEADAAYQQLLANYSQRAGIAKAVDHVADAYRKEKNFQKALRCDQYVVDHWPQAEHAMEAQKGVVRSNIALGDQTAAQAAVDKLISDYSSDKEAIADVVDFLAGKYEDIKNYEKALELYHIVVDRWPNTQQAKGTLVSLAKVNMNKGNDAEALAFLQKIKTDFSQNAKMRKALRNIAERYENENKNDKAKEFYATVKTMADSSSDEDAATDSAKAQLALATIERVLSKIKRGEETNLDSEIASLVADFQGNGDLPKQLRSIARRFGKCIRYKEAMTVYQRLLRDYPDTEYGLKAVLGAPRMKISALIDGGEEDKAQGEITKLIVEQTSNSELGDTLYFLARRFERAKKCSVNRYSKAIAIHQHVINNWPGSRDASRARLDILKDQLLIAIETGNDSNVISELDQLMASNKGEGHLKHTISRIAEQYFKNAQKYDLQDDSEKAKAYYEKAVVVWEKYFGENFKEGPYTPEAYYWAAMCHQQLENYQQSTDYYQKVVDDHPDYRLAGNALFSIGHNYEKVKESGALSESQADLKTKTAYEQLLEKYPGSKHAQYARNWIDQYNAN